MCGELALLSSIINEPPLFIWITLPLPAIFSTQPFKSSVTARLITSVLLISIFPISVILGMLPSASAVVSSFSAETSPIPFAVSMGTDSSPSAAAAFIYLVKSRVSISSSESFVFALSMASSCSATSSALLVLISSASGNASIMACTLSTVTVSVSCSAALAVPVPCVVPTAAGVSLFSVLYPQFHSFVIQPFSSLHT